ncbi:MAG: pectate lyase [Paraglaciecola sp.]|uniref:pectate lyase n=1 Tax=Paraglaciecola sp. TaxID=1920173 RepID=UPI0032970BF1
MNSIIRNLILISAVSCAGCTLTQEPPLGEIRLVDKPIDANAYKVRLSEVIWHGTDCYKIDMPMGTVYFEKGNGVSGFKSFLDNEGNDWIASYLPPGPNGDFRGFPNSVGNFGHAGRDSGSTTKIVNGITQGDVVILESTNGKFTFQYYFFTNHISIKVLKSEGEYHFLLETVTGGTADQDDYFVTADGKQHTPNGEFWDFTPEWIYMGDPKANNVMFFAKSPDDDAPNENHRQIRPNGQHNMDLYSFGRTGKEHKYKVQGMSGNEHIAIIGFAPKSRSHNEITALIEGFLEKPFTSGVKAKHIWTKDFLNKDKSWFSSQQAINIADSVIQYQSAEGGFPKSTDLARPPLTLEDVPPSSSGRANTIDNDATTLPMQFLARMIEATDDDKYKASFTKGLDYLFAAQYDNGGWPQFWPLRGKEYYSRVTFNDDAMIQVMALLKDVTENKTRYAFISDDQQAKASNALQRGLDFILKSQVRQNGKLTSWAAQYDEQTIKPAWARAYEPPSLSGSETVGIVRFLMSIERPSPEIINSVESAVAWLQESVLKGVRLQKNLNPDGRTEATLVADENAPRLWARFYELGSNRPIYLDRDSVFNYEFHKVGYERRSGYAYHGYWAEQLISDDYPNWKSKQIVKL